MVDVKTLIGGAVAVEDLLILQRRMRREKIKDRKRTNCCNFFLVD